MKRQPIKSIGQLCPQKNVCITRNIFCFIMQKTARNTVNNKHLTMVTASQLHCLIQFRYDFRQYRASIFKFHSLLQE